MPKYIAKVRVDGEWSQPIEIEADDSEEVICRIIDGEWSIEEVKDE